MIEPVAMSDLAPADANRLRQVLRRFAAGVTVITTRKEDGSPAGMTATAFTSVSLDPPIALVCLNEGSRTAAAVLARRSFAVNILAADQRAVADRFASAADDKFAGLDWTSGSLELPILEGTVAALTCNVRSVTEAGTHMVVLADVLECAHREAGSLVYLDGAYLPLAAR